MSFLGIDIGTTSTKALVLSDELKIVAEGTAEYSIHFNEIGSVEQDPSDWWNACCEVLQRFWEGGTNPKAIKGIAVSGHGASLVVTDSQGNIIRPAISSLDTRCTKQTDSIRNTSQELILAVNGNDVGAFNFEPKLLWLKETEPEHYKKMPDFLSATGYINYKLTGKRTLNVSDGGIGMAFDRRKGDNWNEAIIQSMGLDVDKFPEISHCLDIVGEVHAQAAIETGLPAGIPVIAGGEDTSSAALSMGITKPGDAYISLGTQGTVGVCTDKFEVQPEILGFPHVLPGLSLLNGSMSTCGAGLQWFVREWCKDLTEQQEQDPLRDAHSLLMDLCQRTTPGAKGLLFLPYLSGELHPILDENAAGVFFGLRLEHTREDMARAVMEGSAHAIRHNLFFAEQVADQVKCLKAVGGPTKSSLWCQIIADITERSVEVVRVRGGEGGAPLGNAILAMHQFTKHDIRELLTQCSVVERRYEPTDDTRETYRNNHEVYKQLYCSVKHLFQQLQR